MNLCGWDEKMWKSGISPFGVEYEVICDRLSSNTNFIDSDTKLYLYRLTNLLFY